MSDYPSGFDSFPVHQDADGVIRELILATDINDLGLAIEAIQIELGLDPRGTSLTVADRFNELPVDAGATGPTGPSGASGTAGASGPPGVGVGYPTFIQTTAPTVEQTTGYAKWTWIDTSNSPPFVNVEISTDVATTTSDFVIPTVTRSTHAFTSAALASEAVEQGTMSIHVGYRVLTIATSRPARVRLYIGSTHQTADAGRAIGVDPAPGAGVVLDYVSTDTSVEAISPVADGWTVDETTTVPITVTNTDTVTGTVVVDLLCVRTE